MINTCETCRYYSGVADNVCKLHPPKTFFFNVNPVTKSSDFISAYPKLPLGKDDWCGQHMPKTTILNS